MGVNLFQYKTTSPVFMVESPFGLFLLMWLTVDLLNKWFFSNLVEK